MEISVLYSHWLWSCKFLLSSSRAHFTLKAGTRIGRLWNAVLAHLFPDSRSLGIFQLNWGKCESSRISSINQTVKIDLEKGFPVFKYSNTVIACKLIQHDDCSIHFSVVNFWNSLNPNTKKNDIWNKYINNINDIKYINHFKHNKTVKII